MSCPHPAEASRSCLDTPLYRRPHKSKCLSSCHVVATFDSDASNTHLNVVREDALRRKFALYGRQHAHINHLTRIQQETTAVLQSTMLLQEEGVLAAKLDHITYLLDGLLLDSYKAPRAHVAHNRSILELTQLIQEPQILQAITLSSQRCRVKQLLVKRLQNDVMTRLSVAVLVYFLASSVDADEYIDHYVSRAIVDALVLENEAKTNDIGTSHETVISMPTSSLKRCLKRKQSVPKCTNPSAMVSSTQVLDTLCQMKLDKLLQDHDVFYAGNELQITVSTALCAALYKLLQVDESTSFNERLSCQDRMKNFAVNTLETRKQELLQLGGLDFFMQDLVQHVYRLESGFLLSFSDGLTVECTRLLHLLSLSLRVLDQATFRMIPVQHYVCKHETVLTGVLTLIRMLSELSWGIDARRKWKTASVQMFLCVDVLMLALRVALNLTHQNGHAAEQVHAQKGMQLLVQAFLKLSSLEKNSLQSWLRKKWQFDAELLLLTVMVNSIECSEDNRIALAEASVRQVEVLMAHDRVCDHFVQYFLSKVQSYKHLIDGTEADLISANDEWNPEDVILGGCTSLLLGYLMIDSMSNRAVVLKLLPDHTPRLLLRALAVFVAFYSQIGALTSDVAASALLVEKILKTCGESGIRDEDNEVLGVTAMKSNVTEIVPCFVKHSTCKALKPPALRNRVLKNVCSRLDDSDEENEVNMEAQQNGRSSRIDSEFESLTRDHSLLGWEQCRITPSVQTSVRTGSSEPRTRISSPVAVMPDGSMSSPVITRLLHQTRQLVREFDLNFATSSRLAYAKKADEITEREAVGKDNSSSYLCMVMTMDVTCRDSGHDSLDLKQDMGSAYTNDGQTNSRLQEMKPVTQTKRRKKVTDNCKVSAIKLQLSQDEISSSPFPLTPQRDNKSKVLLQTPPRAGRTPDMYRQSPLLHLTPTKSSPSTPLWIEKTSRLLQTPPKTKQASLVKESLLSHGRNRRKMKMVRAPTCARAASIFDFTD
ncbi:hypothetical protein CCR75_000845 [Bremia lactucae]|uniref:Wings apart-like protein C-terminal domain-containing protein n=1 Tax=Bremia lactucae TaxID=4779 RepID=A0A976FP36_BRELC|nr:hypothetical protein CCR75_000845 [Bremia lactucae]